MLSPPHLLSTPSQSEPPRYQIPLTPLPDPTHCAAGSHPLCCQIPPTALPDPTHSAAGSRSPHCRIPPILLPDPTHCAAGSCPPHRRTLCSSQSPWAASGHYPAATVAREGPWRDRGCWDRHSLLRRRICCLSCRRGISRRAPLRSRSAPAHPEVSRAAEGQAAPRRRRRRRRRRRCRR